MNEKYAYDSNEKITELALSETSAREVPQGALMLGMYDTAALKSSIAGVRCSCNQAIAFAKISNKRVDLIYVFFAIQIGRDHFRKMQRGVRQKNLNLSLAREIRIPLPPIDAQRRFAQLVAKIEYLKTSHHTSLAQLDALFASLQHRAFRGDL